MKNVSLSQLIKNLETEKDELMKNLNIAESKSNEKKDINKTTTLENMLENKGILSLKIFNFLYFKTFDKDRVEREIKEERDRGKELDSKIQECEKKLRNKRREVGGSNAGANFQAYSKKQEKVLENRLDHVS